MYKKFILAAGLLAGTAAAAQTAAPDQTVRTNVLNLLNQNFDKADVNNDGFLGRNEVQTITGRVNQQLLQRVEQEFKQLDKDKNGQVSLAEFKTAAAARIAQNPEVALQKLDTNKDGKVSPAEFRTPALTVFDRIDANKDGKISPQERQKAGGR